MNAQKAHSKARREESQRFFSYEYNTLVWGLAWMHVATRTWQINHMEARSGVTYMYIYRLQTNPPSVRPSTSQSPLPNPTQTSVINLHFIGFYRKNFNGCVDRFYTPFFHSNNFDLRYDMIYLSGSHSFHPNSLVRLRPWWLIDFYCAACRVLSSGWRRERKKNTENWCVLCVWRKNL